VNPQASFILISVVFLFIGMLACIHIGRNKLGSCSGAGPVEGAVFALFGLLIAFTFSGAASRFEVRRDLVVEEANRFSTAWARLDLLPKEDQPEIRSLFRSFLDRRLSAYESFPNKEEVMTSILDSERIQRQIWNQTAASCIAHGEPATTSFILGSLNELFDICATRSSATETHPPFIIFALLFTLGLISAFLGAAGSKSGKELSWAQLIIFALVICVSVYVTLELEFPRLGLIRVDSADHQLIEFRELIKSDPT
jgi:hypothetical protein